MTNTKRTLALALGALFVAGAGYVVMVSRPASPPSIANTQESSQTQQPSTPAPVATDETPETMPPAGEPGATPDNPATAKEDPGAKAPSPKVGDYVMADVEAHATPENCWTTINGSVYDLTSWVSRHPGGPGPIGRMCGKDGTQGFQKKHGSSKSAQSALFLLKIGVLVQ